MIDSSACVRVITAGLIGREEHWDIVITDTPGKPLMQTEKENERRRESTSCSGGKKEMMICAGFDVGWALVEQKLFIACYFGSHLISWSLLLLSYGFIICAMQTMSVEYSAQLLF